MFKLTSRLVLPFYQRSLCSYRERLHLFDKGRTFYIKRISRKCFKEVSWENKISCHPHVTKVYFHTSKTRNALPAVVILLMRPLTRFIAVVFGRTIRIWWRRLPLERRDIIVRALKKRKYILLALLTPIPLWALYFYVTHVEETPITKRKRFVAFSTDQMIQLAAIEEEMITADLGKAILDVSHPAYCRVHGVILRILNSNKDVEGINDYQWRIFVIHEPENANAFVLPNGAIFIFTGMLNMCSNDNELGIVMGHEMAHTLLRHTAENMSNAQLLEFMLFVPFVLIWALLPDLGAVLAQWVSGIITKTLVRLPFSRQTEMEADDVGLKLAAKACFDVREATCFWKKMKEFDCNENDNIEWLSTHPSYDTRVMFLEELMPSALKLRDSCQCPKLLPYNPHVFFQAVKKLSGSHTAIERQIS